MMNWKIERDPFYSSIYSKYEDISLLEESGFFFDSSTENEAITDPRFMCSPINKALRNLTTNTKRPAVLLTSGGFSPCHTGHLESMELAKCCAESNGFDIIGGYICPSHDEYVSTKSSNMMNASSRVSAIQSLVKDSEWLMVDRWESLVAKRATNFTDVILHLQSYLSYHLNRHIDVIYVFGGDNARFAITFYSMGYCVCVSRPGYDDKVEKYKNQSMIKDNPRIMWTVGNNDASSSKIRNGDHKDPASAQSLAQGKLSLRNEGTWSIQDFIKDDLLSQRNDMNNRWNEFVSKLSDSLKTCTGMNVVNSTLSQNKRDAFTLIGDNKAISIDGCIEMDHNLRISRLFDVSDDVQHGFTNSPESDSIENQVAAIPDGKYVLFDDDIATGNTIRFAKSCLRDTINIYGILSLAIKTDDVLEIADCRDFLFGSNNGGLVVKLPNNEEVRAPYIFPYVDPVSRVSVRDDLMMIFSREIWQWNYEFYKDTGITVSTFPEPVKNLAYYIGFTDDSEVEDVIYWHIENIY